MWPKLVLWMILHVSEVNIDEINEYLNRKFLFDKKVNIDKPENIWEEWYNYKTFVKLSEEKKKVVVSYNIFVNYLVIDLSFSIKPIFVWEDMINNEDYVYGLYPYDICSYIYPLCEDIYNKLKWLKNIWLWEEIEYYDVIDENGKLKEKDI